MYQWIDSLARREIIFDVSSGGPSSGISKEFIFALGLKETKWLSTSYFVATLI